MALSTHRVLSCWNNHQLLNHWGMEVEAWNRSRVCITWRQLRMGRQTSRANKVQGRQNEAYKKFTRWKKQSQARSQHRCGRRHLIHLPNAYYRYRRDVDINIDIYRGTVDSDFTPVFLYHDLRRRNSALTVCHRKSKAPIQDPTVYNEFQRSCNWYWIFGERIWHASWIAIVWAKLL